jgi:oligogalacturonide lyase
MIMSEPERITQNFGANEQLLYFTSTSLTCDDTRIVFISGRTGHPNIFSRDLVSGEERQLSNNEQGYLKSYVYFDGVPYRRLGKASTSFHAPSGALYYIQGREIRKVTADGEATVLAQYPDGQMTAFTHVSADGKRLCVPTTDAYALDADKQLSGIPKYNIDERVQAEGLSSYLRIYDTDTGDEIISEQVERCWITHVQFSPINSDLILYNHEWPADCGIRRMWLFDGTHHLRLRTEGDGRSHNDWACHEMWERDGSAIIYHGGFLDGPNYLGRVKPDGSELTEIALKTGSSRYGHFTVGIPNILVSDGYYEEEGDNDHSGGDWISLVEVNWEDGTYQWFPQCRNSSSWDSQDAHPHPIIDHASKFIYFTSDMDGKRAIYRIALEKKSNKILQATS